jgi:hypothetical protein
MRQSEQMYVSLKPNYECNTLVTLNHKRETSNEI